MVYFFSLLHLTDQTENIRQRLEKGYIFEPVKRLPFKAFMTWIQLEMYLNRHEVAQELINEYISSSTHLADPKAVKPPLENGNQSDDASSDQSWDEEENAGKGANDDDRLTTTIQTNEAPARMLFRNKTLSRTWSANSSLMGADEQLPLARDEYF